MADVSLTSHRAASKALRSPIRSNSSHRHDLYRYYHRVLLISMSIAVEHVLPQSLGICSLVVCQVCTYVCGHGLAGLWAVEGLVLTLVPRWRRAALFLVLTCTEFQCTVRPPPLTTEPLVWLRLFRLRRLENNNLAGVVPEGMKAQLRTLSSSRCVCIASVRLSSSPWHTQPSTPVRGLGADFGSTHCACLQAETQSRESAARRLFRTRMCHYAANRKPDPFPNEASNRSAN